MILKISIILETNPLNKKYIDLSEKTPQLIKKLSGSEKYDIEMSCVLRTQEGNEGDSRANQVYADDIHIRPNK